MSRRVIAAGLLSLTFVAACSDGPDRRSSALPPRDQTSSTPDVTVSTGPSIEAEAPAAAPAPATAPEVAGTTPSKAPAKSPAPAPAPQQAQPRSAQTTQAAPKPASEPTRTATRAPAPQPSPTRSSAPAPAPAPAGQFALTIRDFAFSPRILNVPVGSTVTATNQDEATHDWTSNRGVWGSGDLRTGQTFSFTFRNTGTFDYLCERHPQMTGTVNVT